MEPRQILLREYNLLRNVNIEDREKLEALEEKWYQKISIPVAVQNKMNVLQERIRDRAKRITELKKMIYG